MVKTRQQKLASAEDEERLRTIQPPKVCCTTPPRSVKKRPAQPPSAQTSTRKKKLMFAPDPPQEFLFEFKSPPARRLVPHNDNDTIHDSVVRIEFEMRGGQGIAPVRIGEEEHSRYREWVSTDLKRELKTLHGFDCDNVPDNLTELRARLELAETLRRRSEVRRVQKNKEKPLIPNEMALKDLHKALSDRRIAFFNLTHFKASEALERALIKEDAEGLIGEGYQFGRRMVSAADLISYWQPSDKEMRDMLQQRSNQIVAIPKKKSEKLALLSKILESEQEQVVRELVKDEMIREIKRRGLEVATTDDYTGLFEAIFQSGKWRDNYDDVDNTPLDPDEHSGKCCVM